MTTASALRSRGLWASLFVAAVMAIVPLATLTGCGRGRHYSPDVGTLEIRNDITSTRTLEYVDISVPFGPVDEYAVFLQPGEDVEIDLWADSYDIDLYWSNGDVHTYYDFDIFDGDHRVITAFN